MMKPYPNHSGKSPISRYDDDTPGEIIVEYLRNINEQHRYVAADAGALNIEEMKRCARCGAGLSEFINQNKERFKGKRLLGNDRRQ